MKLLKELFLMSLIALAVTIACGKLKFDVTIGDDVFYLNSTGVGVSRVYQ